jgi:hypothetical protein
MLLLTQQQSSISDTLLIQQSATSLYSSLYSNLSDMTLAIQQYSNHDNHSDTATCHAMLLLLPQQSSRNSSALLPLIQQYSYYDPHTDTTICYDTTPLIIHKSICQDIIITVKLLIRYPYWYSNLPYYYTVLNTTTSLIIRSATGQYYRTTATRYIFQ